MTRTDQKSSRGRLLVANRGEIACRILRACRSLQMDSVAVYSEPDRGAMHVGMADEAIALGGTRVEESYGCAEAILRAAETSGATALHPGYGFLSENAEFAASVIERGITWVGPAPGSISDMGDKGRAREVAREAGVPVLPGSRRLFSPSEEQLHDAAREVGYPFLVKASGGGGGIGMRAVHAPNLLASAAASVQSLGMKAFGDSTIYLERYVPRARHVEVQVFGYGDGTGVHLHSRDCSVQRRFQKLLEEAPATQLPPCVQDRIQAAALALVKVQQYDGAGTVEFLVDTDTGEPHFLEMNTRLQVEHPVTEMLTGVDLVQWQILHALGELTPIQQTDVAPQGHAIECRIYAERPERQFLPSPGHIQHLVWPRERPGVRVDAGVRTGDEVTPHYDPMLGKIIVHGPDRDTAIGEMASSLSEIQLTGVGNNVGFLARVMTDAGFASGPPSTSFVDDFLSRSD